MVRKMQIGQLQGAAITAVGLHEITPEPQAVDVPRLIDNEAEADYVQEKINPELEGYIAAKGFVVIQWGEVGFAKFFSTKPYATPQDASGGKVFSWEGDPAAEDAWRKAGLHPVVVSSTDIIPSLQTGMINIVTDPPLYAYTTGIYEKANNMTDVNWGFLTGATVVRQDAWEKIPPEMRPKLLDIAHEYGKRTVAEVRKMNADALKQMKDKGLKVITPADMKPWDDAAQNAWTVVRGKVVPAAVFDKVRALRDEYRAQHGGSGSK
jgi:TRAP-type C4-dicarboxylate transport system substrate-binding protein